MKGAIFMFDYYYFIYRISAGLNISPFDVYLNLDEYIYEEFYLSRVRCGNIFYNRLLDWGHI